MTEPREGSSIEEQRRMAEDFLGRLAEADGTLIHLRGKKSRLGEDFYVCARCCKTRFWGEAINRLMGIDVFVIRDNEFLPVGRYDWEIKGNSASGNKNRHDHLPITNLAHEQAATFWATGEGFKVLDEEFINYAAENGGFAKMRELRQLGIITHEDQWTKPIYQDFGIGSFMIAVSAYVLQKQGVAERQFVSVSRPGRKAWERYGIDTSGNVELSKVTEHPFFKKSIEDFTGLPLVKM